MSKLTIIQTFVDYNYTLHEKMWESIMQLTDEQFLQGVDHSHGSVRNQMLHLAIVDRGWRKGLQGDPNARQYTLDEADFTTRASLYAEWQQVAQEMQDYVAGLDEDALNATMPGMNGPTWEALLHIMNHGTDHRAQTLRVLHDLGASTFDQDMIFHLWFRDR